MVYCAPGDIFVWPSVKLPEQKNAEGVTAKVRATEDLMNWSSAKLIDMLYNESDGTWKPADGIFRPAMFFKWHIDIGEK